MTSDVQFRLPTNKTLCVMKEVLSGDWQSALCELSVRVGMRPRNTEDIDVWLEMCEIAQGRCNRAQSVFQAHRNFHGC